MKEERWRRAWALVRPPHILPLTGVRRAIPHRYVGATAFRTNTVQWRTDNPVRPPERTSSRPAFGWIHGLTDRIVRPPHILPLTGVRRAIPHRYVGAISFRTNTVQWRTDNPVRAPRENVPEAGIWVDSRFDGQDCPASSAPESTSEEEVRT